MSASDRVYDGNRCSRGRLFFLLFGGWHQDDYFFCGHCGDCLDDSSLRVYYPCNKKQEAIKSLTNLIEAILSFDYWGTGSPLFVSYKGRKGKNEQT